MKQIMEQAGQLFTVRFADINIEIHSVFDYVKKACCNYIVSEKDVMPSFSVAVSSAERHQEELSFQSFPRFGDDNLYWSYDPGFLEFSVIQKKIADTIPVFNAFLMHGSVIAMNGNAYMFSAPSGTGKSTRSRIWLNEYPQSVIVNGDKPFIKVSGNEVLACGTPWCGKEGLNTNMNVPLRAIFMLERTAIGEETSIQEVSFSSAFPTLLHQTYHPANQENMRKTISLLKFLEGKVKLYRFRSTPTPDAIHLAYNTAKP